MYTKVIDVSAYNPITDYNAVRESGVGGAIIKFIRKNLKADKLFRTHLTGFRQAQVPIMGVYTYSYANTAEKAKSDALAGVKVLAGLGLEGNIVWLDYEDVPTFRGKGRAIIDSINIEAETYRQAGYRVGLYTGLSFFNSYIKPYINLLQVKDLWIARYYLGYRSMSPMDNPNSAYRPRLDNLVAWQYTSSGVVKGIHGNVDVSEMYRGIETVDTEHKTTSDVPVVPSDALCEAECEYLLKVNVSSTLRVRSKPTTDSSQVAVLKDNAIVQAIGVTSNGWWKLANGYIHGNYASPAVGTINCGALNIRSTPNTDSKDNIITSLAFNTSLVLLSETNGMYRVMTTDGTLKGYCAKKYLRI